MHYFGIITTLPFSYYDSPKFAQQKPNGRLRLLVDFRKINNLISGHYIENNHPVHTLTNAAQHLADKKLFFHLDCSQAYHVLQMADEKSVQLLAFKFASRTFAYLRLGQGLSRSLSSFSSFMREFLDKASKADKCAQYVDDIGIATNTSAELKNNDRSVSMHPQGRTPAFIGQMPIWCDRSGNPMAHNLSPRSGPTEPQDTQLHEDSRIPKNKERTTASLWVRNLLQKLHSPSVRKNRPFPRTHQIGQASQDRSRTDHKLRGHKQIPQQCLRSLAQTDTAKPAVRTDDRRKFQKRRGRPDDRGRPRSKNNVSQKDLCTGSFGSKTFSPSQLKMSIYAKEFLAIFLALLYYSHILWGASKATIVLTDNQSVTRFG